MSDALYQELILDHNRKPRNYHPMADADREVEGHNPLCGDQLHLWVKLGGNTIDDVSFQAQGCAISRASASLMTTAVKGKSKDEALAIFDKFHDLVTGQLTEEQQKELGGLRALGGVSKFPLRVKCASLSWHALKQALTAEGGGLALNGEGGRASNGVTSVSTEDEGPGDMRLEGA